MKKILLCWLLLPLLGICQDKNVVSTNRVFPKPDKTLEFEKGLAAHAQKYHTGDWKWRVYEIMSGPDAGGYHIVEGPNAWETFDKRGNLGNAHTTDWDKTVAVFTTGAGTEAYSRYEADLSTVQLTDYADKIVITRMFPKPGMISATTDIIKRLKKVWQASGESVAVYSSVASGPPQFITVTRMKGGLKELDPSFRKPLQERFNDAYGDGAWTAYLADYSKAIDNRWSELLSLRKDLGSK